MCMCIPTKYRWEVQNQRIEMGKKRKECHRSWSNQKKKVGRKRQNHLRNEELPLSVQGRKDSSGILIQITEKEKETTKEMKLT